MSVLFFHLEVPGFSGGFVGVDIFFVISGYLITRNIVVARRAGRWSFREFYGRRVRRLFPAAFATLLLSFLFGFLVLSPAHFQRLGETSLYASLLTPNVYFWLHSGYFSRANDFNPLLHFWSLGVEEQYYLLWPVLLITLLRARMRLLLPVLVVLALTVLFLSEYWLYQVDRSAAFYLLPFRAFGLATGALLVFVPRTSGGPPPGADLLVLLGLGMIGYAVAAADLAPFYPGLNALAPVLGAALLIYAGQARALGHLLHNRPMVAIGLVSYSLYLIHWPLLVFYQYWTLRPLEALERIGLGLVALLLAGLMYRFVEQPFRASPKTSLGPAGFANACLMLTLPLMFLGAVVWAGQGLPWRAPELAAARPAGDACRAARKSPGCFLGATKPRREDILLIGDSQAKALSAGIHYLARKHGLKVRRWTRPACPPLFDVQLTYVKGKTGGRAARCNTQREAWKRYIQAARPKIVILSGAWSSITENPTRYGLVNPGDKLIADPASPVLTKSASRALFPSAIKHTVETITRLGSRVILLSPVPMLGVSPHACFDVPAYLMDANRRSRRCRAVSFQQMMGRIAYSDAAIASLAGTMVTPVLAKQALCSDTQESCSMVHDGRLLYRDFIHLNKAGSLFVVKHFEPVLSAAFKH